MRDRTSRLMLVTVLAFPLLIGAALAGYALDRWTGTALGLLAVAALPVVGRLERLLHQRGTGPFASTLPMAVLATVVGYAVLGGFGIFVGVFSWLPMAFGRRTGERMLRREEAARRDRLRRAGEHSV